MTDILVTASCRPGGWARAEALGAVPRQGWKPGRLRCLTEGLALQHWQLKTEGS